MHCPLSNMPHKLFEAGLGHAIQVDEEQSPSGQITAYKLFLIQVGLWMGLASILSSVVIDVSVFSHISPLSTTLTGCWPDAPCLLCAVQGLKFLHGIRQRLCPTCTLSPSLAAFCQTRPMLMCMRAGVLLLLSPRRHEGGHALLQDPRRPGARRADCEFVRADYDGLGMWRLS